ncbi:MAG: hypothetical protein KBB88_01205 [Candidatus Pacebacteria bacterium]|nr:hypothetical protein [Candidatus Paceibacterota bacterium]
MKTWKKPAPPIKENEIQISQEEFLASFNENMPSSFPKVTPGLLQKFKDTHKTFFKKGTKIWSLDQHRKKLIDWLPRNTEVS